MADGDRGPVSRWHGQGWIALAAAFVSLCALATSVYSSWETRKHNRLSSQPWVTIAFWSNATGAGWKLANEGLGPAITKTATVVYDKETPCRSWGALVNALFAGANVHPFSYSNFSKGEHLREKTDVTLLWFTDQGDAARVTPNKDKVKIAVCYCSIYDECWIATNVSKVSLKKVDSCEGQWSSETEFVGGLEVAQ